MLAPITLSFLSIAKAEEAASATSSSLAYSCDWDWQLCEKFPNEPMCMVSRDDTENGSNVDDTICSTGTFTFPSPTYPPGVTGHVTCSIDSQYELYCSIQPEFDGPCTSFVCDTILTTLSTTTTSTTSSTTSSSTSSTATSTTTTTSTAPASTTIVPTTTSISTMSSIPTSISTSKSESTTTTNSEIASTSVTESIKESITTSTTSAGLVSSSTDVVPPAVSSGPALPSISTASSTGSAAVNSTTTFATQPNSTVTVDKTIYTTYCDEPTTFTWGGKTFTVTRPTTLTITSCPDEGCEKEDDVTTTLETTIFTTYCPEPTTFTWGSTTYTITEPTTLTICPEETESGIISATTVATTESPENTTLTGTIETTLTIHTSSSHGANTTPTEIPVPTAITSSQAPPIVNGARRVSENALLGAIAIGAMLFV